MMENSDVSGSQPGYTQAGKIDFSGKVALVTGGGTRHRCHHFAGAGAGGRGHCHQP